MARTDAEQDARDQIHWRLLTAFNATRELDEAADAHLDAYRDAVLAGERARLAGLVRDLKAKALSRYWEECCESVLSLLESPDAA